ncbi:hypothetical protein [Winogradskyella pulchriflava]|uniref:Glycine zipper family protein n=1 Tax=Winogradskyella pulchriflava TaxID=1110688 RepID=A0ABV6Q9Y6_9FLAO
MKYLIFILTLSLCYPLNAQEKAVKSNTFLRVYNLEGKKIAKGKLLSADEFNLKLKRHKKIITISLDSIGKIKTRRSFGNNILIGSSIGAGAVILISSGSSEAPYEGYTGIGTLFFSGVGAGLGAISAIGKNARTFQINADKAQWEAFRSLLTNMSD